jgi:hypothetical protein
MWTHDGVAETLRKGKYALIFKTVTRVKLSLASGDDRLLHEVLEWCKACEFEAVDVDFGWSIYKGQKETRVDVTFHEGTVAEAITFWVNFRAVFAGVDCGRVYAGDDDWCCKDLHNFQSRVHGLAESFPGHNYKLGLD